MALSLHHCPLLLTVQWSWGNGRVTYEITPYLVRHQVSARGAVLHVNISEKVKFLHNAPATTIFITLKLILMMQSIQTFISVLFLYKLPPFSKYWTPFWGTRLTRTACASFSKSGSQPLAVGSQSENHGVREASDCGRLQHRLDFLTSVLKDLYKLSQS